MLYAQVKKGLTYDVQLQFMNSIIQSLGNNCPSFPVQVSMISLSDAIAQMATCSRTESFGSDACLSEVFLNISAAEQVSSGYVFLDPS